MSKPLEIKIYQTDLGYSILINNVVPRDELGFEISFTSLNETLCYLFYDLGRKQEINIVACEVDETLTLMVKPRNPLTKITSSLSNRKTRREHKRTPSDDEENKSGVRCTRKTKETKENKKEKRGEVNVD